jgi:outer membrane murein-binding lipoprotein Lpp
LSLLRTEAALAAALLAAGCAAAGGGPRLGPAAEAEALHAEVAALRAENQQLARSVEALAARMDAVTARLTRSPAEPRPNEPRPAEALPASPLVPEGLAVIRVEPGRAEAPRGPAREPAREGPRTRRAPPVSTAVPIGEPDPATLSSLARPSGRELSVEADAELRAARKKGGVARAHALEDFATRYPRHPLADDALLEASGAYAEASLPDAACSLARRIADEYPAGDALAEALWRQAECESRAGASEAERRLLHRLVTEFPSSAAARRAGERLEVITGRAAVASPAADPARSGP